MPRIGLCPPQADPATSSCARSARIGGSSSAKSTAGPDCRLAPHAPRRSRMRPAARPSPASDTACSREVNGDSPPSRAEQQPRPPTRLLAHLPVCALSASRLRSTSAGWECHPEKGEGIMRGKIAIGAAILAALLVGMITVSFAAGPGLSNPTRIHVVEHPKSDHVTNTGKSGDTAGDLLTFHNPIYNGSHSKRIGHDQGDCIRISPKHGTR